MWDCNLGASVCQPPLLRQTDPRYQQLLPDGSVVINLGDKTHGSYMDEFMTEGSEFLRAIYARDFSKAGAGAGAGLLVARARDLILEDGGFEIPVPTGLNLSPALSVLKAYAHITQGPSLGALTPFSRLDELGCIQFATMNSFTGRIGRGSWFNNGNLEGPKNDATWLISKQCHPKNPCLMVALGQSWDEQQQRGTRARGRAGATGPDACAWFNTTAFAALGAFAPTLPPGLPPALQ